MALASAAAEKVNSSYESCSLRSVTAPFLSLKGSVGIADAGGGRLRQIVAVHTSV